MGKHYWREILPKVLALEEQGYTHQMVAEKLGYTYKQIKGLMKRYHKKQREQRVVMKKRGRPRTRPLMTEQEYQNRIKQLEMENALLRSFLQAAGRM